MINFNEVLKKLADRIEDEDRKTGIPPQVIFNRINLTGFKQIQKSYVQDHSLLKKALEIEGIWRLDVQYGPQFETKLKTERAGDILIQTDETTLLGGGGTALHPLSLCLAGFCGCFCAAYSKWSSMEKIKLKSFKIVGKADLDLSASLVIEEDLPMLDNFQLDLFIESDASMEKLLEILEITEKRCFCSYCITTHVIPKVSLRKEISSSSDTNLEEKNKDLEEGTNISNKETFNRINLEALKKTQKKYSQDRSLCKKTLEVEGIWRLNIEYGPQFEAKVKTERAGEITIQTDETIILGGGGTSLHPVSLCIAGFNACFCTAYAKWIALEGIELKSFKIKSKMFIDLTTSFGILDDIPMIDDFKVELIVDTNANMKKLREILEVTKKRCLCYYCYSTPIFPNIFIRKIISETPQKKKEKRVEVIEKKAVIPNLLNFELQNVFKKYFNETGKYANWGTKIKNAFFNKIDEQINRYDISHKQKESLEHIKQMCKEINKNQEIQKFISDKIQNTYLSQREISNLLKEIGLNISNITVGKIAKKIVYSDNLEAYNNRFPSFERVADAIKKKIHFKLKK